VLRACHVSVARAAGDTRPAPFYRHQERASEYKTQQRQNTPEEKALFEAVSRIIKPGERENHNLDKAAGCVTCSKPAHKDARSRESPYSKPKETINSGSGKSSVAAPPAIDVIADEEEDSDDEEKFRSA
jgi:hypothetical protein